MRDFPPLVADLEPTPLSGHQGPPPRGRTRARSGRRGTFADPDTRSPARFLGWLLAQQRLVLFVSAVTAVLEWVPGAIGPYVIGRIVDEGIIARDLGRVGELGLVLFGLVLVGVTAGVLNHTVVVRSWLIGMYGPMMMVNRKSVQLGHVLPQRTPTGEVLSVAAGDADEFGALTEIFARAFGALVSYLVIAGLVLSTSVPLGVMVLVAAPLIVVLALPLLPPLQRREEVERTRSADLTGMATDIVAGLRILRGIGGEHTFARNYADQSQRTRQAGAAAGVWQALVESASVLFSGLFLVVLTWLGAREVVGRAAQRGRADQLLRVRAVHGLADPDLLRAGPALGPVDRVGPQGDRGAVRPAPVGYAGAAAAAARRRACCTTSGRASPPSRAS